jgi:cell division protein FtsZ
MSPAAPAKVFAFPGRAAPEPAPRAAAQPQPAARQPDPEPAPAPVAEATPAHDDLGLGLPTEEEASDELLLGEVDMVAEEEAAAPADGGTRTWVAQEEQEAPKPREGGGTLFERMSNIARGAAKAQVDDDAQAPRLRRERDPLDIPRFLNRQNNQ